MKTIPMKRVTRTQKATKIDSITRVQMKSEKKPIVRIFKEQQQQKNV